MNLNGKIVLITGGAAGIGAACGIELAKHGARVSIADMKPPSDGVCSGALFTRGDITDAAFRSHVVERTLQHYGTIDILINNAGIGLYAPAENASLDLVRRVFEVNVFASLGMSQIVVPLFRAKGGGAIVNLGSIGGEVALPWASMYCASKFAMHCVSQSLRRELAPSNIRVITVMPGVVATGFRSRVLEGTPPPNVARMMGMPPEKLARQIRKKLEGRGSAIFVPWYGRIFALVDRLAPGVTDAYMKFCWPEWLVRRPGQPDPRASRLLEEDLGA